MGKLSGKVVIVTGATDGIGKELSEELGTLGVYVVVTARRKKILEEVASKIRSSGGKALVVPADLGKTNEIANIVRKTVQEFGRIDALINVAAMGWYDWLEEITAKELQEQYQTNVIGMADLIRQVIPVMKNQKSGHIINFSSYASRIAVPPETIYASTKYAIEGLTEGLRRELSPWGIKVTRVHPWAVHTKFNEKAARHNGIVFPGPSLAKADAITGVTTEMVAKKVIDGLIHPKRAIYITKWRFLIETIVLVNHFFPGIVDFVIKNSTQDSWTKGGKHDLQAHAAP